MKYKTMIVWIAYTFLAAITAGIAIGLGGTLFILAKTSLPGNIGHIIGSIAFSIGLIIICYGRFNLYTGKIGIAFNKNTKTGPLNVYVWLAIILLGNAAGAFGLGYVYRYCFRYSGAVLETVDGIGLSRVLMDPLDMFIYAILCGILVYLAIYLFNISKSHIGKVIGIIIPISLFVYLGFQHCIANMFYMAFSGYWNIESWRALLICIIGNSLGALLTNVVLRKD